MRIKTLVDSKLLLLLLAASLGVIAYLASSFLALKRDNVRLTRNTNVRMVELKTANGQLAAQASAYRLTVRELKESQGDDRNGYAEGVRKLKAELANLRIRIRDMDAGVVAVVSATDTVEGKKAPAQNGPTLPSVQRYLFYTKNDSSEVIIRDTGRAVKISRYWFRPTLMVILRARNNRYNKPHWFLPRSRWLWGTQRTYVLTTDLPNAKIDTLVVVEQSTDRE